MSQTCVVGGTTEGDSITWSARLGAHLESSRLHSGLRRADLASRLGVSEETIRLWERGAVQPSPDHLARLIAMLSLEEPLAPPPPLEAPELPPLARKLRAERTARGLTQAAASTLMGVPQATYAGWETGRATPTEVFLRPIAEFLGTSADEIAALREAPFVVDHSTWPPLGQVMGRRRQQMRLTRSALAEATGVSERTIVNWELGYRVPDLARIDQLASALSVSVDELGEVLPKRRVSNALGELILRRQRELGLRSSDVAALAGSTPATVSRWVNGHSAPGPKNLERLALALRLSPNRLAEAALTPGTSGAAT